LTKHKKRYIITIEKGKTSNGQPRLSLRITATLEEGGYSAFIAKTTMNTSTYSIISNTFRTVFFIATTLGCMGEQ
jgi:hypothetical protein